MKKFSKQDQCPLAYQVDIDVNSKWYDQIKVDPRNPLPVTFLNPSPALARRKAFSYVAGDQMKKFVLQPDDFVVSLIDTRTCKEIVISRGLETSDDLLENLDWECLLYEEGGYDIQEWTLMSDEDGNAYRVIENDQSDDEETDQTVMEWTREPLMN